MTVQQFKEVEDYRKYTSPAELHKAVNTLRGLVAGITTDRAVSDDEINELSNWCLVNSKFSSRHPFSELIPKIKEIYEDGIITEEESADILWLCNNFVSDSDYYDLITSSIQFLSGLMHGIMADGEISDKEVYALSDWVRTNEYLSGCYPFDELESLICTVLADGKIDDDERNILKSFFSNFIDTTSSYNLNESELKALPCWVRKKTGTEPAASWYTAGPGSLKDTAAALWKTGACAQESMSRFSRRSFGSPRSRSSLQIFTQKRLNIRHNF